MILKANQKIIKDKMTYKYKIREISKIKTFDLRQFNCKIKEML